MTAPAKAAPMREDVTQVIQADRDAAAMLHRDNAGSPTGAIQMVNGDLDDEPDVQAFKSHRLAHTARPDAPWHTDLGSLQEAQRIARAAYRSIEIERDRNTHIPGSPYGVALSALNSTLAAVDQLIQGAVRPDAGDEDVERVIELLEHQMETQESDLPSSLARERGLTWLEGWFDLPAALAAMREGVDRGMVERAKTALMWAIAEIDNRTIYRDNEVWSAAAQRENAFNEACDALAALDTEQHR